MTIEVTQEAVEVLRRSLQLAPTGTAGVRLRGARGLGGGFDVVVELADGPLEGERVLGLQGFQIYVDPAIEERFPDAMVAVEPQHEVIVVRPRS